MTPTLVKRQSAELTQDIDRCGYLLELEKSHKQELAALKIKLRDHCNSFPGNRPIRLEGRTYYLNFSAREMKREITDKPKCFAALRKAMGIAALVEALSYTFKLLDAHVSEAQQSKFVEITQTGSRDVTGGLINTPAA